MKKSDLQDSVVKALRSLDGVGSVADIAKKIWEESENELREAGELFYTWQYDMRWAGQILQKKGVLKKANRKWTLLKSH